MLEFRLHVFHHRLCGGSAHDVLFAMNKDVDIAEKGVFRLVVGRDNLADQSSRDECVRSRKRIVGHANSREKLGHTRFRDLGAANNALAETNLLKIAVLRSRPGLAGIRHATPFEGRVIQLNEQRLTALVANLLHFHHDIASILCALREHVRQLVRLVEIETFCELEAGDLFLTTEALTKSTNCNKMLGKLVVNGNHNNVKVDAFARFLAEKPGVFRVCAETLTLGGHKRLHHVTELCHLLSILQRSIIQATIASYFRDRLVFARQVRSQLRELGGDHGVHIGRQIVCDRFISIF